MTFETQLTNNKKEAQAWLNGRYVTAQKGNDGWYYAFVDGKLVRLDNQSIFFVSEPFKDLSAKTQLKINERREFIKYNYKILENLKKSADKTIDNIKEFLATKGLKLGQEYKLNEFEDNEYVAYRNELSKTNRDITRTNLSIDNALFSNMMDAYDLMKYASA